MFYSIFQQVHGVKRPMANANEGGTPALSAVRAKMTNLQHRKRHIPCLCDLGLKPGPVLISFPRGRIIPLASVGWLSLFQIHSRCFLFFIPINKMARLVLSGFKCFHLQPIDLEVAAGECVALSGASGSGKTLLLRSIADLEPNRGQIFLDHIEHLNLSGPQWRRRVALLPAESHWWADRVRAHATAWDDRLLTQLNLAPECLDWSVSRLSSGERQRLALARQLARQPEVLLLDEPTANLDPSNQAIFEQCIGVYRETRQAAVIWVSHDSQQRHRVASREFRIDGNILVAESTHEPDQSEPV